MSRNRGSALISALFIMTLVAIAATAMSTRVQWDIHRTQTSMTSDKLYLASQAVTWWAMEKLANKKVTFTTANKTGQVSQFPTQLKHIYPDILTSGALIDMQSRFNINNLQDEKLQSIFYHLLENTAEKNEPSQFKLIFKATKNWIGAYQPEREQDPFLDFYTKQKPAYYPAFQPMQTPSEFRMVYSVTAPRYETLIPYLTALPEITPVNINTASTTLLKSLGNGLNESQVDEILSKRGKKGIANLIKISQLLKKLDIPSEQVTIESHYFLSVANTSLNTSHLTVYTLLKRLKNKDGDIVVSVVNERLNTI